MSHARLFNVYFDIKDCYDAVELDELDVFESLPSADYAVEISQTNAYEDVKGSFSHSPFFKINEKMTVSVNLKEVEAYLGEKLMQIKDLAKQLTTDNFTNPYDSKMYSLSSKLNHKFGDWFYVPGNGYMNSDDFLRYLLHNQIEEFGILQDFDYHY